MSRGSSGAAEVPVVRATPVNGDLGTVLSASGYIVAHHKITVNSKVTGRVAWIGVEKGDKVKEGQVLGPSRRPGISRQRGSRLAVPRRAQRRGWRRR